MFFKKGNPNELNFQMVIMAKRGIYTDEVNTLRGKGVDEKAGGEALNHQLESASPPASTLMCDVAWNRDLGFRNQGSGNDEGTSIMFWR